MNISICVHRQLQCLKFVSYSTRVRFAPSPTGLLHVGGLKTALINYIFAKSTGGKLILRIEDTDQSRFVKSSVNHILKALKWLNISFDEGVNNGTVQSNYIQSNRLSLYKNAAEYLLKENKAYYCFCSSRRLEFLRSEQIRRGENIKYDRKCFNLSKTDIKNRLMQQAKYTIRLKLENDAPVDFNDCVFGNTNIPIPDVESDPVLIKSDGYPVYHLANVVDDHEMEISHVIRGQEWLISTPKHRILYNAFGWKSPVFAHLPLIVKKNGLKISKRDSDFNESFFNIDILMKKGFTPEVVIAWLMSCGGGLTIDWYPSINLREMIDKFSLHRITTHNARLDKDILDACGRNHFTNLDLTVKYFNNCISNFLNENSIELNYDDFNNVFKTIKHRMTCLEDIKNYSYLWSYSIVNIDNLIDSFDDTHPTLSKYEVIGELLTRFAIIMKTEQQPDSCLNRLCDSLCKKSSAMKCLRMVLINQPEGPKITELLTMLSVEEIIRRVNAVMNQIYIRYKVSCP